jgi:hypothetical protein
VSLLTKLPSPLAAAAASDAGASMSSGFESLRRIGKKKPCYGKKCQIQCPKGTKRGKKCYK